MSVSWDYARSTPDVVHFGQQFQGTTGAAALTSVETDAWDAVSALFGISPDDELVLRDEHEFEQASAESVEPPTTVIRRLYDRYHLSYPVFTEVFELTARSHDWSPADWAVSAYAQWTRDLPTVLPAPLVVEADAVLLAKLEGEVVDGQPLGSPRLGIWPFSAELAYEIVLASGGTAWRYYVSASSGQLLFKGDQVAHYDGTLQAYVSRPREGNTKTARPIPEARVYEDINLTSLNAVGCPQSGTDSIWQTKGTTQLGQTSYSGTYSLSPIESGDTSWAIDQRGPKIVDKTNQGTLSFPTFTAGGVDTFPLDMTSWRARRAEIFYLLSYGYNALAASNVTQSSLLQFSFYNGEPGTHCSLDTTSGCCNGAAIWAGNDASCVTIDCSGLDNDMGTVASAPVERRYRYTILHELGHTLFENATVGARCVGSPDKGECLAAEEGRSDYMGMALTRFDSLRCDGGTVLYRPNKKYPADFVGDDYDKAQIWASMYAHLLQRVGVVNSLQIVNRQLSQIGSPTQMVGSCTDTSGDGYITHYECPSNSYYRHLLNADWAIFSATQYHGYEISEVLHRHVTDADRVAGGVQNFPWADQLPNDFFLPPIISTETVSSATNSSGPEDDSGAIRFDQSAVNKRSRHCALLRARRRLLHDRDAQSCHRRGHHPRGPRAVGTCDREQR